MHRIIVLYIKYRRRGNVHIYYRYASACCEHIKEKLIAFIKYSLYVVVI